MDRNQHWIWFALLCVALIFHAWVNRYEYSGCDLDGCVVIDRWTGELYFEPLETESSVPVSGARLVGR
jgi:hypothetical protein